MDRRGLGTVTSMVTLAEDLFLLATEASTGQPMIDITHLDLGLGGALLLDLVLQRRMPCVTPVSRSPTRDLPVTRCSTGRYRKS